MGRSLSRTGCRIFVGRCGSSVERVGAALEALGVRASKYGQYCGISEMVEFSYYEYLQLFKELLGLQQSFKSQ